jgi:hypothetical protein
MTTEPIRSARHALSMVDHPLSAKFYGNQPIVDWKSIPHNASAPSNVEEYKFTPTKATTFTHTSIPLTIEIDVDKRTDFMKSVYLKYDRTAITSSGGALTTGRYDDYEFLSSIYNIEIEYNNKVIRRVWGEKAMIDFFRANLLDSERKQFQILQGGNLTDAQRNTRGAAATQVIYKIPHPWDSFETALPFIGLSTKLKFKFNFKPLNQCLAALAPAGTPTVTISNVELVTEWIHLPDNTRSKVYNDLLTKGREFKISDSQHHRRETITAAEQATLKKRIPLRNLQHDIYSIIFTLRDTDDIDTTCATDLWNFRLPPLRSYVTDSGSVVSPIIYTGSGSAGATTTNLNTFHLIQNLTAHPRQETYVEGVASTRGQEISRNIVEIPFTNIEFLEASEHHAFNSRRFSEYNNPELVLEWEADPSGTYAGDLYCDIWADHHQMLFQGKGDLRVLFGQ